MKIHLSVLSGQDQANSSMKIHVSVLSGQDHKLLAALPISR